MPEHQPKLTLERIVARVERGKTLPYSVLAASTTRLLAALRGLADRWMADSADCYEKHYTDCLCGPQQRQDADQLRHLMRST